MKRRSMVKILLSLVAVAVVVRLMAPVVIEYYLNEHMLADLGAYSGKVEDVDLAVWRGAFRIEGLQVEKTTGDQQVEFLRVPVAEAALSWRALSNGAIRAKALIDRPEINFVDGERPEERQSGAGIDWQALPDELIRFTVEEVEVRQGTVAFRNFTSNPPVNIQARNVNLTAINLTNIEDEDGERVATAEVTANVFGESPFSAKAEFDPFDFDSFLFAGEMTLKDLTEINPFTQAYANLDFKSGHGELVMELEAEDRKLTGYAKPAFENVDVADWEQDVEQQEDNPLRLMWEGLAGLGSAIFSNPETDKLATRIEISGDLPDRAGIDMWSAVFGIVRNAFADAINTNFDHLTPLEVPDADAAGNNGE